MVFLIRFKKFSKQTLNIAIRAKMRIHSVFQTLTLCFLSLMTGAVLGQISHESHELGALFEKNCYSCHGPETQTAGINLTSLTQEQPLVKNIEIWRRVIGALDVDALADVLLHPHLTATCATAEGLLLVKLHLDELDAVHSSERIARAVVVIRPAVRVAGVVVGDAHMAGATQRDATLGDERVQELAARHGGGERGRDVTVDWVHLKVNDQALRTVLCKDPFAAVDERVDRLIEQL